MSFHVPEKYRLLTEVAPKNPYATTRGCGNYGLFFIPFRSHVLAVIATDGQDITGKDRIEWEHVSASLKNRCPNWEEMSFVKDLFWDSEDMVIQFHPPKSQYVNQHPFTLHMWRPVGVKIPLPPSIFVGLKNA